jgi:hypothetical protein
MLPIGKVLRGPAERDGRSPRRNSMPGETTRAECRRPDGNPGHVPTATPT